MPEPKKSFRGASFLALIAVLAALIWWLTRTPVVAPAKKVNDNVATTSATADLSAPDSGPASATNPGASSSSISASPTQTAPSASSVAVMPIVTPPATSATVAPNSEIQASARMYTAHASLRAPEVADPDSKANQQILQVMLLKVFAQPASNPPVAAPSKF